MVKEAQLEMHVLNSILQAWFGFAEGADAITILAGSFMWCETSQSWHAYSGHARLRIWKNAREMIRIAPALAGCGSPNASR